MNRIGEILSLAKKISMDVVVSPQAQKDLHELKKAGNKATIKRIARIFQELGETPCRGIGNPEPLKHEWSGYWSREIDKKNRIVYRIDDSMVIVYVISAKGHYGDK